MKVGEPVAFKALGVDLSGPANHADTCMAWRNLDGRVEWRCDCSDQDILTWQRDQSLPVSAFIDAPLSYQDGGGYRHCDAVLRAYLNAQGLNRLGVMAPTMTKMVYLTLRGISLSTRLRQQGAEVFETHPGASMLLSGMEKDWVYDIKRCSQSRSSILALWTNQGNRFVESPTNDHQLMAIQCLLTAERWLTAGAYYWRCESWLV